ncbi:MAG: hypothetical protein Kow00108_02690 [Calditrichia bacterium]
MKKVFLLLFIMVHLLLGKGTWKNTVVSSMNINQVSFTNWQKGGENAVSWSARLDGRFYYKDSVNNWDSNIKLVFGQTKTNDDPFKKSVDEIRLTSVYSKKMGIYVDPYISLKIESQIAPGYKFSSEGDRVVSKFFDPGYFTQSVGVGLSPVEPVKIRAGLAVKETFTFEYPAPYADDPNTPKIEKTKVEKGAELSMDINWEINKTVLFKSNTAVFSNLEMLREVDVKIDNLIVSKLSKYFNINFEYNILYDYNQSKKIQIREAFAFGVSINLL